MGKTWCVYKHIFPDGKLYIGSTGCRPDKRWANGYGYSGQTRVFEAIVKYGWNNIKHEIVAEKLSEEDARKLEKTLIENTDKEKLYNGELYTNGRIITKKKPAEEYIVGGGTTFDSLSPYISYDQRETFHQKIGCTFPFVEMNTNYMQASYFKSYDDSIECTQWIAFFPEDGVQRKEFGNWLANKAEFLKIYHGTSKLNLL